MARPRAAGDVARLDNLHLRNVRGACLPFVSAMRPRSPRRAVGLHDDLRLWRPPSAALLRARAPAHFAPQAAPRFPFHSLLSVFTNC